MDYQNWEEERQKIIEDVLRILRDQRDDIQDQVLTGTVVFNPRTFEQNSYFTVEKVRFDSPFNKVPKIVFGQIPHKVTSALEGVAGVKGPFLVMPYVDQWYMNGGKVEGFILGAYRLNTPSNASVKHEITWLAKGPGSAYNQQQANEKWMSIYNNNSTGFLHSL